jgi:FtsZ-binding cell division protein ZapB
VLFEDGGQAPSTPVASALKRIDMAQTSFNIQPCKVTASERHNKREKALSYVRSDLSHLNEWCDFLNVHLVAYDAQMRQLVKAKTGRKMQEKSRALYEGLAVIRPDTTIEDIKKLADAMHQRWGFHFVQLAIHKDEGSWQKDGTWKPNLHAHMVFDKIDHETGKTIKTTAKDTAEMQDMCARILGMERGQRGSKKEHLDALEYKVKIQEKRAALAEQAQKTAEEKQEAASERAKEIAIKNADAVFKLQNKNAELTRTAKEVENLRSQMQFSKGVVDSRIKRIEALRSEISGLSEQKNEVLELIGQKEQLKKDVLSLECRQQETQMELDVLNGEVFMKEKSRDILQGEVQELTQERDKAKQETAAARASLQELTRNKEHVKTWKWAYQELLHIIQPVLDAITRLAHYNGRGGMFTAFETFQINMALGKDDKREERAARYTRWAKEDEEKPQLYGDYRYQCAGEEMQKIAKNASAYLNSIKEGQSRGMGY